MGSPDFALPSLEALHGSGRYSPLLVVSQPDRRRGRGRSVSPTPVRLRATEFGIPTVTMAKGTYAEAATAIASISPEVIVVVAFGVILRRDLLELPPLGCINVHASLLPKYRGVSPIQAAILAGERVTGCTTMHIEADVDTGGILLQEETDILPSDTAGTLSERLSLIGANLLVRTLDGLFDGAVRPVAQDAARATYTKKIRKEHGAIDWAKDAAHVERHVRAMTPWPSAFTFHRGRRLIVAEAAEGPPAQPAARPGEVVSLDPLRVACASGTLDIHELRPEGRRAMTPAEFLAGNRVEIGEVLGAGAAH